jgi:BlaI family penicillinase repressor
MAKKRNVPRLSAGEIELLQMLWREGEVTLSMAHKALGLPIGYTTVQTRLNRLVRKGVAARSLDRPARYRAAIARDDVSEKDLNTLIQRVSVGNVVPLVAHLVRDKSLTADQIVELRGLLVEAEKRLRVEKKVKKP